MRFVLKIILKKDKLSTKEAMWLAHEILLRAKAHQKFPPAMREAIVKWAKKPIKV
jgi:hypothetical protein